MGRLGVGGVGGGGLVLLVDSSWNVHLIRHHVCEGIFLSEGASL